MNFNFQVQYRYLFHSIEKKAVEFGTKEASVTAIDVTPAPAPEPPLESSATALLETTGCAAEGAARIHLPTVGSIAVGIVSIGEGNDVKDEAAPAPAPEPDPLLLCLAVGLLCFLLICFLRVPLSEAA